MLSRIKEIIEAKNLTPSRFADHVDVPRSTISHILSGRNKPSLEVIQKILEAFPDIPAEWLVRGKGLYDHSQQDLFSEFGNTGQEVTPFDKEEQKEEVFEQFPNQVSQQVRGQTHGQTHGQVPGQTHEQVPGHQISGQVPGQTPGQDIPSNTKSNDDAVGHSAAQDNKKNASSLNSKNNGNQSVKVIVLYADGTYSEYLPR